MRFFGKSIVSCLGVVFLQGCNVGNVGSEDTRLDNSPVSTVKQEVKWPKVSSTVVRDEVLEKRVAELVAGMTLEEKVGQMIQPEIKFITPEQVTRFHIGSVLNGGGTAPNNNKFAPVSEWVELADAYYNASAKGNNAGIPLLWGSDAVHGHNNVIGATLFPHNIGLGAARDKELIRKIGAATAKEVAVTGIDWTFAPTVAVVRDDRWGRTYESYSEDPAIVRDYAKAMVEGIQGEDEALLDGQHLLATAKHFLGDGGTTRGIDRGDTEVSEQELLDIHASGFIAALEAGVQTVMASFNSWNGVKMHGNKYLLTEVLKEQMGFDGFVVGDWNGHRQVPGCSVESCPHAINAGLDMFMVPSDWEALYNNTLKQARSGEISIERVNDAVTRIIRVKARAGLLDKGLVSTRELSAKLGVMGGKEHRALAREAVRKSLVLLKNDNKLLPLHPKQKILVAGSGADDISKQSGGWTISWQGMGNTKEDFPGATTIFEGIKKAVDAAGGQVALSIDGSVTDNPDVAVVVIGENPYAEWHGDIASIEYQYGVKSDLDLLNRLKDAGIPVVTLFLSGRPLWVNKELNASDAFVAAWLPGSEGDGIADVIFTDANGDAQFDFVGKLSFSWPEHAHQTVLNYKDKNYAPLFAYGYGLDYSDKTGSMRKLTEENTLPENGQVDDAWLLVSRAIAPWGTKISSGNGKPEDINRNIVSTGTDDNMTVTRVDKVSQEDARKINWKGGELGNFYLSTQRPQDFSIYLERKGYLQFSMKVDQAPEKAVSIGMACADNCSSALAFQDYLTKAPVGQWQTLSIDLQCFASAGMDFSKALVAFSLSTQGALDISLADLKMIAGNDNKVDETALLDDVEQRHFWRCEGGE